MILRMAESFLPNHTMTKCEPGTRLIILATYEGRNACPFGIMIFECPIGGWWIIPLEASTLTKGTRIRDTKDEIVLVWVILPCA